MSTRPPNTFFILALGRSGTKFLADLLATDQHSVVYHEPWSYDPKILSLSYAGHHQYAINDLLKKRFNRLFTEAGSSCKIYGEVNSYLRYNAAWLTVCYQPKLIHLVRNGRDFVHSAYARPVYTALENTVPIIPKDNDPHAQRWEKMSRFEKLCWYWNHTNIYLLKTLAGPPTRFEQLVSDYDYFKECILCPTGLSVSVATWEKAVKNPVNTSRAFLKSMKKRRSMVLETCPPPADWDNQLQKTFRDLCGETMEALGYEA